MWDFFKIGSEHKVTPQEIPSKTSSHRLSKYKISPERTSEDLPSISSPQVIKKPSLRDRAVSRVMRSCMNTLFGGSKSVEGKTLPTHEPPAVCAGEVDIEDLKNDEMESTTAEATDSARSTTNMPEEISAHLLSDLEGRASLLKFELKYKDPSLVDDQTIENRVEDLIEDLQTISLPPKDSTREVLTQIENRQAEISQLQREQESLYQKVSQHPIGHPLRQICRCQIVNVQFELSIRYADLFGLMSLLEESLLYKQYEIEQMASSENSDLSRIEMAQIRIWQMQSPFVVEDFSNLHANYATRKQEIMMEFERNFLAYTKLEDKESTKILPKYAPIPPNFGETIEDYQRVASAGCKHVKRDYERKIKDVFRSLDSLNPEVRSTISDLNLSPDLSFEEAQFELDRFSRDLQNGLQK